ncbi:MAG: LamG-like jellyroll fold domain-containing protein [bacterium]
MSVRYKEAFTLIEVFVVMSIITFLFSIILVSLQSARTNAVFASTKVFSTTNDRAFGASAIALWDFDTVTINGSQATIFDSSGSGNNLIITDKSKLDSVNTYNSKGNSLNCNASCGVQGGYITLKYPANFMTPGALWEYKVSAITSSAWVYFNTKSATNFVLNVTNHPGFSFKADANDLNFQLFNGSGAFNYNIFPIWKNYTTGSWHHIAASYKNYTATVYLDGKAVGSYAGNMDNDFNALFYLAWDNNDALSVDDVSIYSNALTAEAVGKIYAKGRMGRVFAGRGK